MREKLESMKPKKRKKYCYKPETIDKMIKKGAEFVAECMIDEADATGMCMVRILQDCLLRSKDITKEGKADDIVLIEPSSAIKGSKIGLCEILYNPFLPDVDAKSQENNVKDFYVKKIFEKKYGKPVVDEIQ